MKTAAGRPACVGTLSGGARVKLLMPPVPTTYPDGNVRCVDSYVQTRQSKLLEIVDARHAARCFMSVLHRWQKASRQSRDDRDQKLNERKGRSGSRKTAESLIAALPIRPPAHDVLPTKKRVPTRNHTLGRTNSSS